jgi:hypothetical protein
MEECFSEEMKAFFGVILNMALNLKAQLVDYFTEDWLDRTPFFKDVFSHLFSPDILDAAFSSSCRSSRECAYPREQGEEY